MAVERKTVIVTGGASGIGRAISEALIGNGYSVLATGRKTQPAERVAGRFKPHFHYVCVDHAQEGAAERVVEALMAETPSGAEGLVGLVNNVGRRHNDLIGEHTSEHLANVFALNVTASMLMTQAVVPILTRNGGGSVVNISSRLAVAGMRGVSGYAASKGALNSFTVAASVELAERNIRVNAVAPGMTKTPLIAEWLQEQPDPVAAEREQAEKVPLGRLGVESDVAHAVSYLISPQAAYITGAILPVDGGYTAA